MQMTIGREQRQIHAKLSVRSSAAASGSDGKAVDSREAGSTKNESVDARAALVLGTSCLAVGAASRRLAEAAVLICVNLR
jgi:hypothetical protein